jgi:hypothetical protein
MVGVALPTVVKTAIEKYPELTIAAVAEIKDLKSNEKFHKLLEEYEEVFKGLTEDIMNFVEANSLDEDQSLEDSIPNAV